MSGAPATVRECQAWLLHVRRHRCAICDGHPVKRINSVTRDGNGWMVTVSCHGEVTSSLVADAWIESCDWQAPLVWFGGGGPRDRLAKLDRHGRVAGTGCLSRSISTRPALIAMAFAQKFGAVETATPTPTPTEGES